MTVRSPVRRLFTAQYPSAGLPQVLAGLVLGSKCRFLPNYCLFEWPRKKQELNQVLLGRGTSDDLLVLAASFSPLAGSFYSSFEILLYLFF